MPRLSIIIPCYFNEHNIPTTSERLLAVGQELPEGFELELIFVDDGSKDQTHAALLKVQQAHPDKVKVVKLSRNFGSSNAVLAGMHYATGDCNLLFAADLQDPPELIPQMVAHWQKGIKLVIANRISRQDPLHKKATSAIYHRLMRWFALKDAPKGGFDMILFDRQLKQEVLDLNEKNTYLPYLFIWLGHPYVNLPYERQKRQIGKSGYTLAKSTKAFVDSFVAFSFFPLRLVTVLGILLALAALGYAGSIAYYKFIDQIPVEGWSSLMVVLLVVSSFQMIALGIIGEYLWRSLEASRNRPNFVVDRVDDETSS